MKKPTAITPAKQMKCAPASGVSHTSGPAAASDDSSVVNGGTKTDFEFFGDHDSVKGFNEGRMVQHSLAFSGAQRSYFFTLRGGPHYTRNLSKLEVQCLHGTCTIAIIDGPTATIDTSSPPYEIPAGSTFSFTAATKAALLATSQSGPGLGDPIGRIPED